MMRQPLKTLDLERPLELKLGKAARLLTTYGEYQDSLAVLVSNGYYGGEDVMHYDRYGFPLGIEDPTSIRYLTLQLVNVGEFAPATPFRPRQLVQTRDGTGYGRILVTDARSTFGDPPRALVAIIFDPKVPHGEIRRYRYDGHFNDDGTEHPWDLQPLEGSE